MSAHAKVIIMGSHGGAPVYDMGNAGSTYDPLGSSLPSKIDDVLEGKEYGVMASVPLQLANRYAVVARNSRDTARRTKLLNWFWDGIYEPGDTIFLIGYSAGAQYVINLAKDLNPVPVEAIFLIDPVIDARWPTTNRTIPSNVKKVASYVQKVPLSEVRISGLDDFGEVLHGDDWSLTLASGSTSYITSHPRKVCGAVDHLTIDNHSEIHEDILREMRKRLGESASTEAFQDSVLGGTFGHQCNRGLGSWAWFWGGIKNVLSFFRTNYADAAGSHYASWSDSQILNLKADVTIIDGSSKVVIETSDNPGETHLVDSSDFSEPGTPTNPTTSDLSIEELRGRVHDTSGHGNSVDHALYCGRAVRIEGKLLLENEGSRDAEKLTGVYYVSGDRKFGRHNHPVDDEGKFSLAAGEKIEKSMTFTLTVRDDCSRIDIYHKEGHPVASYLFDTDGTVSFYVSTRIDWEGGDDDISSSHSGHGEYFKVTITSLGPPQSDVTVSHLATKHVTQGHPFPIDYTIRNRDGVPATGRLCNALRIYRSNGSLRLHRSDCFTINVAKGHSVRRKHTWRDNLTPGTYRLEIRADHNGQFDELNESNNVRSTKLIIKAPPLGKVIETFRFQHHGYQSHLFSVNERDVVELPKKFDRKWRFKGRSFKAFTHKRPGTVPIYSCWTRWNSHRLTTNYGYATWNCAHTPTVVFYNYPPWSCSGRKKVRQLWHPKHSVYIYANGEGDASSLIRRHGFVRKDPYKKDLIAFCAPH